MENITSEARRHAENVLNSIIKTAGLDPFNNYGYAINVVTVAHIGNSTTKPEGYHLEIEIKKLETDEAIKNWRIVYGGAAVVDEKVVRDVAATFLMLAA